MRINKNKKINKKIEKEQATQNVILVEMKINSTNPIEKCIIIYYVAVNENTT